MITDTGIGEESEPRWREFARAEIEVIMRSARETLVILLLAVGLVVCFVLLVMK